MKSHCGYVVFNTKTNMFIDSDGYEHKRIYNVHSTILGVKTDILASIDGIIKTKNNSHSRWLKRNRQYFKVAELNYDVQVIE